MNLGIQRVWGGCVVYPRPAAQPASRPRVVTLQPVMHYSKRVGSQYCFHTLADYCCTHITGAGLSDALGDALSALGHGRAGAASAGFDGGGGNVAGSRGGRGKGEEGHGDGGNGGLGELHLVDG